MAKVTAPPEPDSVEEEMLARMRALAQRMKSRMALGTQLHEDTNRALDEVQRCGKLYSEYIALYNQTYGTPPQDLIDEMNLLNADIKLQAESFTSEISEIPEIPDRPGKRVTMGDCVYRVQSIVFSGSGDAKVTAEYIPVDPRKV